MGTLRRAAVALIVTGAALPSYAHAAPPANDDRENARPLALPASVEGTTRDATLEEIEPASCGFESKGSVWYSLHSASDRRIVLRLRAGGDLDAVVDVYRRRRSRLAGETCAFTDERGEAVLRFKGEPGADYLIRVSQEATSVPGGFRLDAFSPTAPARPPGPRLARRGVTRALDRLQNDDDAWSRRLRAGQTYRINLATRSAGCMRLAVFPPGARSFEGASPVRSRSCGGYLLYTPGPGEGGRYSFLVQASSRARGAQRYHLQVGPAQRDDTTPGGRLSARVRGFLNGGRLDVVDLYRFDVLQRADVTLRLRSRGSFETTIVGLGGRRLGRSARLKPGRYYAVVRANGRSAGRYRLRKVVRVITSTSLTFNGSRRGTAAPGASVSLRAFVQPGVSGPVTIVVERFDPLSGWHFERRYRTRALAGSASVGYRPPGEGRYRARASFRGTRSAARSESGVARLFVSGPLRP